MENNPESLLIISGGSFMLLSMKALQNGASNTER